MDSDKREKINKYLEELYRWNKKINLTAVDQSKAWEILVVPSLSMLKLFPSENGLKVFDIGSGGGIPAIILAIAMPGNTFFAVESIAKKCDFLTHIVTTLNMENLLPLNVHTSSILEKEEYFESADVVTSRQVKPADVLEAARHLLRSGGAVILHRSPKEDYEEPGFTLTGTDDSAVRLIMA